MGVADARIVSTEQPLRTSSSGRRFRRTLWRLAGGTARHPVVLASPILTVALSLGALQAACDRLPPDALVGEVACGVVTGRGGVCGIDHETAPHAWRPLALEDDRTSQPHTLSVTDGETAPRHLVVPIPAGLAALTRARLDRGDLEVVTRMRAGGRTAPPRAPPMPI